MGGERGGEKLFLLGRLLGENFREREGKKVENERMGGKGFEG